MREEVITTLDSVDGELADNMTYHLLWERCDQPTRTQVNRRGRRVRAVQVRSQRSPRTTVRVRTTRSTRSQRARNSGSVRVRVRRR